MSSYMAFEMTASLSDKAKVPQKQEEDLSNKAREALVSPFKRNDYTKTLGEKTEEDDAKKASKDEEDDELMPSRLIAPKRMETHAERKAHRCHQGWSQNRG